MKRARAKNGLVVLSIGPHEFPMEPSLARSVGGDIFEAAHIADGGDPIVEWEPIVYRLVRGEYVSRVWSREDRWWYRVGKGQTMLIESSCASKNEAFAFAEKAMAAS